MHDAKLMYSALALGKFYGAFNTVIEIPLRVRKEFLKKRYVNVFSDSDIFVLRVHLSRFEHLLRVCYSDKSFFTLQSISIRLPSINENYLYLSNSFHFERYT